MGAMPAEQLLTELQSLVSEELKVRMTPPGRQLPRQGPR